jgi:hypothetical protein
MSEECLIADISTCDAWKLNVRSALTPPANPGERADLGATSAVDRWPTSWLDVARADDPLRRARVGTTRREGDEAVGVEGTTGVGGFLPSGGTIDALPMPLGSLSTLGIGGTERHAVDRLSRAMENCPLGATRNCPLLG